MYVLQTASKAAFASKSFRSVRSCGVAAAPAHDLQSLANLAIDLGFGRIGKDHLVALQQIPHQWWRVREQLG